jgi:subtilisin family serine protease
MRILRRVVPASLLALLLVLVLVATGAASARARGPASGSGLVEVVVTLPQPPLAVAVARDRALAAARRPHALDVRAPAAVSYLRTLASAQRSLQARLAVDVPGARVNWHYAVALDGVSVLVSPGELPRLEAMRGVTVWPSVTYHALGSAAPADGFAGATNPGPKLVGATSVWGSSLATAGQGVKIGIVDDGVDQAHPYFNPAGYAYPPGYPLGNSAYTTPKVIVARAFPSPSTTWKYADRPFDPQYSDHATHVAGIAAGDYDTLALGLDGPLRVSGIAPHAYIGNYKALTVPTPDVGLDGNAPEIAKAIDQAVSDGMNILNLSIGEDEVEPSRDVVVQALQNAAAAGVVSVVAAGNEGDTTGRGSIDSPANTPAAITVAAATEGGNGQPADEIAPWSSIGPTPISLALKPDVTAPGVDVLSSIPPSNWDSWDGTSMATPHVAGAAALLMQRHPTWSVEEIKSALESTGDPIHLAGTAAEVATTREGGGRIDLSRADDPLVFTDPTGLSWGLVGRGFTGTKTLATADAGGGPAPWSVSVAIQHVPDGVSIAPTAATVVAGTGVGVALRVSKAAAQGEATGFVVLRRDADVRRVPFWFRVEAPKLARDPSTPLRGPGLYHGDTAGKASRVSYYRYPDGPVTFGVPLDLSGPEQVFRFTLTRPVANFGVAVVSRARGVKVSPRIVHAGDENRLVGTPGVPVTINPYVGDSRPYPVVAALLPLPGAYDLVFDTPAHAKPGRFTFRFWVNDTTPPSVRLLTPSVRAGQPIRIAVHDSGSGVDPRSLAAYRDGRQVPLSYANGVVSLETATLPAGGYRITLSASDYQEAKNNEDVGPVLPNTRVLRTTVRVRR